MEADEGPGNAGGGESDDNMDVGSPEQSSASQIVRSPDKHASEEQDGVAMETNDGPDQSTSQLDTSLGLSDQPDAENDDIGSGKGDDGIADGIDDSCVSQSNDNDGIGENEVNVSIGLEPGNTAQSDERSDQEMEECLVESTEADRSNTDDVANVGGEVVESERDISLSNEEVGSSEICQTTEGETDNSKNEANESDNDGGVDSDIDGCTADSSLLNSSEKTLNDSTLTERDANTLGAACDDDGTVVSELEDSSCATGQEDSRLETSDVSIDKDEESKPVDQGISSTIPDQPSSPENISSTSSKPHIVQDQDKSIVSQSENSDDEVIDSTQCQNKEKENNETEHSSPKVDDDSDSDNELDLTEPSDSGTIQRVDVDDDSKTKETGVSSTAQSLKEASNEEKHEDDNSDEKDDTRSQASLEEVSDEESESGEAESSGIEQVSDEEDNMSEPEDSKRGAGSDGGDTESKGAKGLSEGEISGSEGEAVKQADKGAESGMEEVSSEDDDELDNDNNEENKSKTKSADLSDCVSKKKDKGAESVNNEGDSVVERRGSEDTGGADKGDASGMEEVSDEEDEDDFKGAPERESTKGTVAGGARGIDGEKQEESGMEEVSEDEGESTDGEVSEGMENVSSDEDSVGEGDKDGAEACDNNKKSQIKLKGEKLKAQTKDKGRSVEIKQNGETVTIDETEKNDGKLVKEVLQNMTIKIDNTKKDGEDPDGTDEAKDFDAVSKSKDTGSPTKRRKSKDNKKDKSDGGKAKTKEARELLKSQASYGEDVELDYDDIHEEGKEKQASESEGEMHSSSSSDGEVEEEDCEEGEIREPGQKPFVKPTCRFYMRGHCTWGLNCRFLHPGVNDKGNYQLIERPGFNNRPPPPPPQQPEEKWQEEEEWLAAPEPPPPPPEPKEETAWERGLRQAKELRKKAMERRELETNFEHKKLNLSIEDNPEYDKENHGEIIKDKSPVKKSTYYDKYEPLSDDEYYDQTPMRQQQRQQMEQSWLPGGYENFEVRWTTRGEPPHGAGYPPHYHGEGGFPDPRHREAMYHDRAGRVPERFARRPSPRRYSRSPPLHAARYMRQSPQMRMDPRMMPAHQHRAGAGMAAMKMRRPSVSSLSPPPPQKRGPPGSGAPGGDPRIKADEWHDPWRRSNVNKGKSPPAGTKRSRSRGRRRSRRSYSYSSSFSSSSFSGSSRSRSRSSSFSSISSRSGSSRSSSPSRSPAARKGRGGGMPGAPAGGASGRRPGPPPGSQPQGRRPQPPHAGKPGEPNPRGMGGPPARPGRSPEKKPGSGGPGRSGLDRGGPGRGSADRGGPERGGPERGGPGRGGPDRGGAGRGGPDRGGQGRGVGRSSPVKQPTAPGLGQRPQGRAAQQIADVGRGRRPITQMKPGNVQQKKFQMEVKSRGRPLAPSALTRDKPKPGRGRPSARSSSGSSRSRSRSSSSSSRGSSYSSRSSRSYSRSRSRSSSSSSSGSADSDNLYRNIGARERQRMQQQQSRGGGRGPPPGRGRGPPDSRGAARGPGRLNMKIGETSRPASIAQAKTIKDPLKVTGHKANIKLTLKGDKSQSEGLPRKRPPEPIHDAPPMKRPTLAGPPKSVEKPVKKPEKPGPASPVKSTMARAPMAAKPSAPPAQGPSAAPPAPAVSKKKSAVSRREELLKQLKAVEDAIAKKKKKMT